MERQTDRQTDVVYIFDELISGSLSFLPMKIFPSFSLEISLSSFHFIDQSINQSSKKSINLLFFRLCLSELYDEFPAPPSIKFSNSAFLSFAFLGITMLFSVHCLCRRAYHFYSFQNGSVYLLISRFFNAFGDFGQLSRFGTKSCRMGRFSICLSFCSIVCSSVYLPPPPLCHPASQPARPEAKPARPEAQPARPKAQHSTGLRLLSGPLPKNAITASKFK